MSTKQKMQLPARKPAKASKAKVVAKAATSKTAATATSPSKPANSNSKVAAGISPKPVKAAAIESAVAPSASAAATAKTSKQKTPKPVIVDKLSVEKSPTANVIAVKPAPGKLPPDKPAKEAKHKHKLVRDSFTMPREEFELIHVLKERALNFKRPTKKSELLRAGLRVLAALDDSQLRERLDALTPLTPGRPKKHH